MNSDEQVTLREIASEQRRVREQLEREQQRLLEAQQRAVEAMNNGFRELRADMVRRDVYQAQFDALKGRVLDLETARSSSKTAVIGMFLTVVSGVLLIILTRGLSL